VGEKIYLKNSQAALILGNNGESSLYIPKQADEEVVSDSATLLTGIAILLKTQDKRFFKYMARRWKELIKETIAPPAG
jgi:hypothetical protein